MRKVAMNECIRVHYGIYLLRFFVFLLFERGRSPSANKWEIKIEINNLLYTRQRHTLMCVTYGLEYFFLKFYQKCCFRPKNKHESLWKNELSFCHPVWKVPYLPMYKPLCISPSFFSTPYPGAKRFLHRINAYFAAWIPHWPAAIHCWKQLLNDWYLGYQTLDPRWKRCTKNMISGQKNTNRVYERSDLNTDGWFGVAL